MDTSAGLKQATDTVCQMFEGKVTPDTMRTLKDTLYLQFKTMHHLVELVPLLVGPEAKDSIITEYVQHSYNLVKQASRESFAQLPRQFPPDGYFSPARSLASRSPYAHTPTSRNGASPAASVYFTPPQQSVTPKAPASTPSSHAKPFSSFSTTNMMTEMPQMAPMEDNEEENLDSNNPIAKMAAAMGVSLSTTTTSEVVASEVEEVAVEEQPEEEEEEVEEVEQHQEEQVEEQQQHVQDEKENRVPPRRTGVMGMFDDPNETAEVYVPPQRRPQEENFVVEKPKKAVVEQPAFEAPKGPVKKAQMWTVGYVELEEEAERVRKLQEQKKASLAATQVAWTFDFGGAADKPTAKIPPAIASRLARTASAANTRPRSASAVTSRMPQTARGARGPLTNRSNVVKKTTAAANPANFLKRNTGTSRTNNGSMTTR